jgi:hypothetical protein
MNTRNLKILIAGLLFIQPFYLVSAQTEVMAWGNITGIRVEGQLMEFETSLKVADKDWNSINSTGRERQRPKYNRTGDTQTVNTEFAGFKFVQEANENGPGCARVDLTVTAEKDTAIGGVYFCLSLPAEYYSDGTISLNNSSNKQKFSQKLSEGTKIRSFSAKTISLESAQRQIYLSLDESSEVLIRNGMTGEGYQVYIRLMGQSVKKDQISKRTINIKTAGLIDRSPVEIIVDSKKTGRRFDGFGGNFRLQNPQADPKVIQYCLDNMRVAWGRVEMPWAMWQPDENMDPVEEANAGRLNKHVYESMQMASELTRRGIPVIVSDWTAPEWAILKNAPGNSRYVWGNALNPEKIEKIYKSLGAYLTYLKQNYGAEAFCFSFNESDLGINVRQTAKEHAEFIKGFGAHLASCGLATKVLLGDNSDATTYDFIVPAMNDPETHKFIGAVSFHSWRGCDDETLKKWAKAAHQLNLPLIIAEGSTDAAAWTYPGIFYEQTFALYEINLYIRICNICQPLSILQWQLTSDYSVLKGEGIFRTTGPLLPTRRFWNLKQLASTPEGSFALPVTAEKNINCAAFGNPANRKYAVHIVNNGAARPAEIKGLPQDTAVFDVYVTDASRGMSKTEEVISTGGVLRLNLLSAALISLISR